MTNYLKYLLNVKCDIINYMRYCTTQKEKEDNLQAYKDICREIAAERAKEEGRS